MKILVNNKRKGFTLIEMVGVLAVIAILAALLVPKIFAAINEARLNNAVSSINTVKSAAMSYYAKYGKFADTNGAAWRAGTTVGNPSVGPAVTNWDGIVLLPEGLIEKPFGPRLGDAAFVQVLAAPAAAATAVAGDDSATYNLDNLVASGNETANGQVVVEAVIKALPVADAQEISRRIDGDTLSKLDGTADLLGRVKYAAPSAGVTDVHIYIAHK